MRRFRIEERLELEVASYCKLLLVVDSFRYTEVRDSVSTCSLEHCPSLTTVLADVVQTFVGSRLESLDLASTRVARKLIRASSSSSTQLS